MTTYNAEVLARNPALDEIFVFEKLKHRSGGLISHFRSRLGEISRLRQRKLDFVLVAASSPQTLKMARSLKPGRVVAAPINIAAAMHEVERTFELGRFLGVTGAPGPLRIDPDTGKARELGKEIGAGPFTAVHISARRPAQRWPLERYASLVSRLSAFGRVILLWAPGSRNNPRHPGDDEAARQVLEMAKVTDRAALVPVPTPDLRTLIAAQSLAERVICPDGGAMHLAAALGRPVVALFGDSPVNRWRPWGVPYRVVRPESHDLADLAIEPVLEAFHALA